MASDKPLIPPRAGAESEMASLLAEIPTWDDDLLAYMYKRFATSRLFRVHHDPEGELTRRAQMLLSQTETELTGRGLPVPDLTESAGDS